MKNKIKELIEKSKINLEPTLEHPGVDTAVVISSDLENLIYLVLLDCFKVIEEESNSNGVLLKEKAISKIKELFEVK